MSPKDLSKLSIEELVQQAREGNRDAWEELLRRYKPRLDAWAARKTPGGMSASEVSQEASLKAYLRFSTLHGSSEGELWNWFKDVLNSTLVDMLRRDTRQKRGEGQTFPMDISEVQDIPALQHTPSQISSQHEQQRLMLGFFLELPEEQREALSLYLLRGESRAALMASSNRSKEALDSLLRRGMRTLVARLEGRAETELREPREIHLRNQTDAALALYFRRLEEGVPLDPEAFAADYPDCADELRSLLRWLEALRALHPPT